MEQYSKKVDWLLKVYWECEKDVEYIINMYSQTSGLPFCERNLFEDICDLNAPVEDPGFAEDFKSTIPSESVAVSDVEVSAIAPRQIQAEEYAIVTVTVSENCG